jgi:hypothetical protein
MIVRFTSAGAMGALPEFPTWLLLRFIRLLNHSPRSIFGNIENRIARFSTLVVGLAAPEAVGLARRRMRFAWRRKLPITCISPQQAGAGTRGIMSTEEYQHGLASMGASEARPDWGAGPQFCTTTAWSSEDGAERGAR